MYFYTIDTRTLTDSIRKNVEIESHVYTDEWKAYKDLDEFNHQKVNHSVEEFVNGQVFTNGIESLWALVKRGYYGIYHQWSVKDLIKNSNYTYSKDNEKPLDKPNIEMYHYFETFVKIGDKEYKVILNAEQYKGESTIKPQTVHLYDIFEVK